MNTHLNIQNSIKSRHLLKKIYFLNKPYLKTSKQKYLNLSYKIYRPFLSFSRLNFLKFCEFWSLPVYPDGTNFNIKLIRNRLRLELIPYLKWFFNKNLFNKISQIQNILDLENQYFQLLLQKIFLTFLQTNSFIFKDSNNKNLFQYILLKLKMKDCLNGSNNSKFFKFEKQDTLLKFNYKNNKRKKKNSKNNLIQFKPSRREIPDGRDLLAASQQGMPQKVPKGTLRGARRECPLGAQYLRETTMSRRDTSPQRYKVIEINQKKYNFLFFPKILQCRILYHFYYSFRQKISFNEINCFLKKLNIKKK